MTYLTVAWADLTPDTLVLLEAGERLTDRALAEIEDCGERVDDPDAYLAGREGWHLDEDGHSHYHATDIMRHGDTMTRTIEYATLYWDATDPANVGWAYNVVIDGEHTSGGLDTDLGADADLDDVMAVFVADWAGVPVPAADSGAWRETQQGTGWETGHYRVA